MSAEEAISWQAWLRRNPRGLRWDNWVQANLHRAIMAAGLGGNYKGVPKLAQFLYKPPEPMLASRLREEARERKQAEQSGP